MSTYMFNRSLMPLPWEPVCEAAPAPDPEPLVSVPAFEPPPGFVLVSQANLDRIMGLIAQFQVEREADQIDHIDYARLLEKERIELLTPPPMFLRSVKNSSVRH